MALVSLVTAAMSLAAAAEIRSVQATLREVVFTFDGAAKEVRLRGSTAAGEEIAQVILPVIDGKAVLPLRQDGYDPVLLGWRLEENPERPAQFVTDFLQVPAGYESPLLRPTEIKGLSCIVDLEDAVALGVRHVHDNVTINQLKGSPEADDAIPFDFDGATVYFNGHYVRQLDQRFRRFHDNGISVFVVFLNQDTADPILRHPGTLSAPPRMLCAFNTVTREGIRFFAASCAFLAQRYGRSDAKYGQISGLIVGNEFQQHAIWYNLGEASLEQVAFHYGNAVRLAWLAAARYNPDLRIYISMEHHWTAGDVNNRKVLPGKPVLSEVHRRLREGGDIPWNLAFHPYPENLFNPCFWNDRSAKDHFDTPKITFRNLEQLVGFLKQPEWLYRGRCRDIALTEQGFNLPGDTKEDEITQAAAYACAFKLVQRHPEISAFILHRHVDFKGEGGLRLGLRAYATGTVASPGEKRLVYDVFKAAGTPQEEAAFAFALPIVGMASWDEPLPPLRTAALPENTRLAFDFVNEFDTAEKDNNADVSVRDLVYAAGWLAASIYQHPSEKGWGSVSYTVSLPPLKTGETLHLATRTVVDHPQSNGVRCRILIDGKEVAAHLQQGKTPHPVDVDLSAWAGRQVSVRFQVDCNGDLTGDWFYWLEPLILVQL